MTTLENFIPVLLWRFVFITEKLIWKIMLLCIQFVEAEVLRMTYIHGASSWLKIKVLLKHFRRYWMASYLTQYGAGEK